MATGKKGSSKSVEEGSSRSAASAGRGDKSVEAFRNALERSLVLSRDRLQEAVDDAVKRGRMTQTDANELVSRLVTRGRQQTDDMMKELERLLEQARSEVESRVKPARRRAERGDEARAQGRRPGARRGRQAAPARGRRWRPPITGYETLNATQVKARLKDLSPADLRKVRTQEKRGKARKGVLDEIEKRLSRK